MPGFRGKSSSATPVWLADDDGNAVSAGSSATGPQPAATSQSVTPATGGASFPVVAMGGANIATGQVPVTTSATLVVAARSSRQKVTLSATSAVVYYVGATGVTTATGVFVAAGGTITLDTAAAVYAVGAAAVTISYVELF